MTTDEFGLGRRLAGKVAFITGAGPITVASRRPRPSARLNVCGIRLGARRACVLGLLGSRPGAIGADPW